MSILVWILINSNSNENAYWYATALCRYLYGNSMSRLRIISTERLSE